MPRPARGIAKGFRALTVAATTAAQTAVPLLPFAALAATAVTVAGCADENDPMTHVDRLKDPATRPGAVNRLVQFFEDAMTRDEKNREGATVKPLLDKIVKPMNEVCVAGDLDERTNSKLIKFMSDARHPDGEPCLVKALKDYKPDSTEEDIRWAARAVSSMKLKGAAGAMLDVFTKMKPSKPKAQAVYRDVYDAMISLADPSWESTLIANIERPLSDPKKPEALLNEVQWATTTSAKILGDIKSEKAVVPLIKVMLTPSKADAHMTSVLALVKIGKSATTTAISLLKGENQDLIKYSTEEAMKAYGDKATADQKKQAMSAHIATAALILATIGRDESGAPLMEAIDKAEDVPRAIIARELPKLPKSPATLEAFQKAFDKTSLTLSLPPAGQNARESLLDSMPTFFDASLVPWLIKLADGTKGDETDVAGFKETALLAMMKMAKSDQWADVEKYAGGKSLGQDGKPSTVGKAFEKEMAQVKDVLTKCSDKLECYLARLADPAINDDKQGFAAIKTIYMVGVLGSPAVRDKLIELMPKLKSSAVRGLAASVIDFYSPKGDKAMADKLQKIVDDVEVKKDPNLMATQSHFRYTIYRLNAKAQ
ncbi:MAG: hypothetical protein IPK82_01605 [Polyangiaceae bacterium]|nr:hypothetical protein [Polyangiaceae bacterium]